MGFLKILIGWKTLISIGTACLLTFLSYALVYLVFSGSFKARSEELKNRALEVSEAKLLFSQKDTYQKKWEAVKPAFKTNSTQDEALNQWVKDLLSHASEEGITFSKLEPQAVKKAPDGRRQMSLYLEFQGDIRKLTRFIYHLLEKDPFSKMDSFSLKKEDSDKSFSYQLTLAKAL